MLYNQKSFGNGVIEEFNEITDAQILSEILEILKTYHSHKVPLPKTSQYTFRNPV